jgi:hypothetical protein
MIKTLQRWILAVGVMAFGFTAVALVPAQPVAAAGCTSNFLTFPAWYDGLLDGSCRIKKPSSNNNGAGISTFIWRIVLNLISIALQLVAYASAGYIIYGGFKYLTSSGSADKTAAARKTILNAVVGLIISFFSVVIVTIVASRIRP